MFWGEKKKKKKALIDRDKEKKKKKNGWKEWKTHLSRRKKMEEAHVSRALHLTEGEGLTPLSSAFLSELCLE